MYILEVSIFIYATAEFITVGWGKKETQFHGSVGKQAATLKPEVGYRVRLLVFNTTFNNISVIS